MPMHGTRARHYDRRIKRCNNRHAKDSCSQILQQKFNSSFPSPLRGFFLVYLIVLWSLIASEANAVCDKVFLSTGANSQGSEKFEAPIRSITNNFKIIPLHDGRSGNNSPATNGANPMPMAANSTTSDQSKQDSPTGGGSGKPMHCLYKFVAREDERVSLNFSSFRLCADEPECAREYVDIYLDFKWDYSAIRNQGEGPASRQEIERVFGERTPNGRFCSTIMPHKIVSLHNVIVLSIYTELELRADRKPLFAGYYEFLKSKTRDTIGPPDGDTLCSHTIYSANKREGEFRSVTYPGVYVKNLRCSYKFIGEPEQRIRLEFLDLDLYSGGPHCPLDSLKIFDGLEETDPLINSICGSHRSVIIYSTREHLLVTFTTLQRETEIQNRGFSAYFEFSDKFFDPIFIQGQNARHIRGSECDQRIVSYKRTRGAIVAPEYRDHPNAVCRYIFEGLQTSLDNEKVQLRFTQFDLKPAATYLQQQQQSATTTSNTLAASAGGNDSNLSAAAANSSSADQCTDNYVRIYTSEQKPDQKQDPNDYDYAFCANDIPPTIESDAASLLLEYNSGTIGGFFRAEYEFIVDFRIQGNQTPPGCTYTYRSDNLKMGALNSPRHPSWYINDMNCTYTFLVKDNEALLLQFTTFKMNKTFDDTIIGYNENCTGQDRVEISKIVLDASEQRLLNQTDIGTYCGTTTPGPILSHRQLRIIFRTNEEHVHYGFLAFYNFYSLPELKSNEFVANCGGNIQTSQRFKTGKISSPPTYRSETYEKRNHICTWNITARPSHRIALDLDHFELEGNPSVRGCATASVRLESDLSKLPKELCGTILQSNKSNHFYVSDNEWLRVTFISTRHASGSNGFSATWTEIKRSNS